MTEGPLAKFRRAARAHRLAGLGATLLVLALPALAGAAGVARLRYERAAIRAGEWWRLVTGSFVHLDPGHLALNLAGVALLWWLFVADARPRDWLLVGAGAALAVGLGLYAFDPSIGWYVGLSGVAHGWWAAAALFAWRRSPLEALVTGALLLAKTALEQWHGPVVGPLLERALPVVVDAHLYGLLGGLALAVALRWPRASL